MARHRPNTAWQEIAASADRGYSLKRGPGLRLRRTRGRSLKTIMGSRDAGRIFDVALTGTGLPVGRPEQLAEIIERYADTPENATRRAKIMAGIGWDAEAFADVAGRSGRISKERAARRRGLAITLARLERPVGMTTLLALIYGCSRDTIERLVAEGDALRRDAPECAAQIPQGCKATASTPDPTNTDPKDSL